LRPHLHPGARVLALTTDGNAPAALARLLTSAGFGPSRLCVLEALGGPRERMRSASADQFDLAAVDPLNTVAIEVAAAETARIIPRAAGLPDAMFEHDGQLTKRELRAITLAALAPRRGERLWDVGAGAGSVAIEWMLADPSLVAVAIEAQAERVARIRRNAASLGVPGLEIIEGAAPAALAGLPPPDAIFVGGGASDPGVIEAVEAALRPGGRLVVNAATLQTEALLVAQHGTRGGELIRVAVARAEPLGDLTTWRPALPIMQWRWVKP
jgi:precorrin-6B C5,15-methyltransferase / cobalt-precorrin-6B C5,C15-methyltransferase